MANCNDLFQDFLDEIQVIKTVRDNLRRSRDGIRTTLENHFTKELQIAKPEFYQQGSFALKTMVKVLNPMDEYDVDDGVYLQEVSEDEIKNPQKASTFRTTVLDAVRKQTERPPQRLHSCIRVQYAEKDYRYHIDLPVYAEVGGKSYLARDDGWVLSDAKAFNKWFRDMLEKTEKMRSCIKYLKAWKDFASCDLKGVHLTVLVGLNHVPVKDRDDSSLTDTVGKIIDDLKANKAIYNPIDQSENLIEDWNKSKLNTAIRALDVLHQKATQALDTDDKQEASNIWRETFGDRFPCHKIEVRHDRKKQRPVPVEVEERPRPWGH